MLVVVHDSFNEELKSIGIQSFEIVAYGTQTSRMRAGAIRRTVAGAI